MRITISTDSTAKRIQMITDIRSNLLEIPIEDLTEKPGERAEAALRKNITSVGELLVHSNYEFWHEALVSAQSAAEAAESVLLKARERLQKAVQVWKQTETANHLRLFLSFFFGALLVQGEYAFTWSTLPALLSIERATLLGLVVGAIPVAATMVLEIPLARLFDLLKAGLRSSRPWLKYSTYVAEVAVLAIIITANFEMIRTLAPAREEASKIMRTLEQQANLNVFDTDVANTAAAKPDEKIIYAAILTVSLAVLLDGALIYLLIDEEYCRAIQRWAANREMKISKRKAELAEERAIVARGDLRHAEWVWDTRAERAATLKDARTSLDEFRIANSSEKHPARKPELTDVVDNVLGSSARVM